MNNTDLLLMKRAYVALLRVSVASPLRTQSQALLATLRDRIAHELDISAERVQVQCEEQVTLANKFGRIA